MHTITAKDREAVTLASLCKFYGGVIGTEISKPLPTITSIDHNAVSAAHICKFKGQDIGQRLTTPLHTITASAGEFATVEVIVTKYRADEDIRHWPKIRQLLNEYCGYNLEEDEVILLRLYGAWWFIADIGLRMLTPKELYEANGFPPDYIIDRDYLGNRYVKSDQVARCGNAVPPPFAAALVRANFPKWCSQPALQTMRQVQNAVAF